MIGCNIVWVCMSLPEFALGLRWQSIYELIGGVHHRRPECFWGFDGFYGFPNHCHASILISSTTDESAEEKLRVDNVKTADAHRSFGICIVTLRHNFSTFFLHKGRAVCLSSGVAEFGVA